MDEKNLYYRLNRMNSLRKNWNLKQEHPLILKYKILKNCLINSNCL